MEDNANHAEQREPSTDVFPAEKRREIMSHVRTKDTAPELIVRSLLHAMGYRFRLHRKDLPGSPDIVLPKHRTVIFVHGCFWHGHPGCSRAKRPTAHAAFWNDKIDRNMARDAAVQAKLREAGWRVLIVWQCQTRDREALRDYLRQFLEQTAKETGSTAGC